MNPHQPALSRATWRLLPAGAPALLILTLLGVGLPAPAAAVEATVAVVRHFEKESGNDPGLTAPGRQRAAALAALLAEVGVTHLFTSEYRRTAQTLEALAVATGLTPQVVAARDRAALLVALSALPVQALAVVAGHSNTVPEIVRELGGEAPDLSDADYGDLFVVVPAGPGGGQGPRTLRIRVEPGVVTGGPAALPGRLSHPPPPAAGPQTRPAGGSHAGPHAHAGLPGQHRSPPGGDHSFADVERFAGIFEADERDEWQKPDEVVAALAVRAGMVVADVGAGTGYFARRFAHAVGPEGTVYAADLEPNMVATLRDDADGNGLPQIIPVLSSRDDPRLPDGRADIIFFCNTWHHLEDRVAYARRLKDDLAPGGRVVVVDFRAGELPVGPPADQKLTAEEIRADFVAAGYRLAAEPDFLPYQNVLVLHPEPSR